LSAAAWFCSQSFHQHPSGGAVAGEPKPDATWSSWDPELGLWRYWARVGDVIWETDEVGVARD